MSSVFTVLLLSLSFLSCASRNTASLPYPDLAIISVDQQPPAAIKGKKTILSIEIANLGESKAPPTTLRLSDNNGRILDEKEIPSLYPQVNIILKFEIPPQDRFLNFTAAVDPGGRVYEKKKENNSITIGIRFLSESERQEFEAKSEKDFLNALKRNNADICKSKIILLSFKRTDKMMSYESAVSGESVKFKAEIENRCDKEVYDITLYWIQKDLNKSEAGEKVFGTVKIEKLIPGEKRMLQRSLTAAAGNWLIALKLGSSHASEEKEKILEPSFILLVKPAEEKN